MIGLDIFKTKLHNKNFVPIDKEYKFVINNNIQIELLNTVHGLRHYLHHVGYLIKLDNFNIAHLGDGINLEQNCKIDCLCVALGGFECNINNSLKLIEKLKPSIIIPMHYYPFFINRVYKLKKIINDRFKNTKIVILEKNNYFNID